MLVLTTAIELMPAEPELVWGAVATLSLLLPIALVVGLGLLARRAVARRHDLASRVAELERTAAPGHGSADRRRTARPDGRRPSGRA